LREDIFIIFINFLAKRYYERPRHLSAALKYSSLNTDKDTEMKTLPTIKIFIMIVHITMSGISHGRVVANVQSGTEKCIDLNAESPSQNVSKSAIGNIFDTFSDVNFCKDQFLVNNDFIGFCGCEDKNTLTAIEIEQVDLAIIERESLSLALEENKSVNEQNKLNEYLIEIMDLKLTIPSSCLELIERQNERNIKCQKNDKRWKVLQSLTQSDQPLEQLDSDIVKFKARRTLQEILIDDTNKAGFSYLMGKSIMSQYHTEGSAPSSSEKSSLGSSITSVIEKSIRKSLTAKSYLESEEILSAFLTEEDNKNYSDFFLSNNKVNNITEQRQVTSELLPLFKNENFKLAFAVVTDKFIKENKLDPKKLSSTSFQKILIRSLERIVDQHQQKTEEAKISCDKIKYSAEYACFETKFNNVKMTKVLYKKHLMALFPSRIAGKMACKEVKESQIPKDNKSVAAYFNTAGRIDDLSSSLPVKTSSSEQLTGIDAMVDSLEKSSLTQSTSAIQYAKRKKRASDNRTIVSSGSTAGRSYATALATGNKLQIRKASKKLAKEIASSKKRAKANKLVSNDINKNDDTTQIAATDDLSEIRKIEKMIKENEKLYGLDDEKSEKGFLDQFNFDDKFKKENKGDENFSAADYFSASNIEPEPLDEGELTEEDKTKIDGAKEKLDGLINRYENLLANQEKKSNKKVENEPAVDARISQLQKSIEVLKSQRNDLLGTIDDKKKIAAEVSKVSPSAVKRRLSASTKNLRKKKAFSRSPASRSASSYTARDSATPQSYSNGVLSAASNNTKSSARKLPRGPTYSGISKQSAPKLSSQSAYMVINSDDFTQYSFSDFEAYFDRFGSEPLVVKRRVVINTEGVKSYQDVLDYYFPEVESGNIKYVKRNPEEVRKAISNIMAKNRFESQIDLTLRTVAKHSELIQLLEN
jgi:hypothetical protein